MRHLEFGHSLLLVSGNQGGPRTTHDKRLHFGALFLSFILCSYRFLGAIYAWHAERHSCNADYDKTLYSEGNYFLEPIRKAKIVYKLISGYWGFTLVFSGRALIHPWIHRIIARKPPYPPWNSRRPLHVVILFWGTTINLVPPFFSLQVIQLEVPHSNPPCIAQAYLAENLPWAAQIIEILFWKLLVEPVYRRGEV